MANNQNTFIQLPMDITNPLELRRFLDKLVQQLDVAFGNRGNKAFALDITLAEVINILNGHEIRLDNIESLLPGLMSDVQDLKDGELIVSTTADIILGSSTETVLCDCSSNEIVITLPDPSVTFTANRSKSIGITKIDTSRNKVVINPFGSEKIVGENTIKLLMDNEIVNLITDGTNWYLGA